MSVDYAAKMAVGIIVDPETFFFETVTTTVSEPAKCQHKIGKGDKFCRQCGAEGPRKVTQTTKKPKPPFASSTWLVDADEIEFSRDRPYSIEGLELFVLDGDGYTSYTYVYGEIIGVVSSYRCNIVQEDAGTTKATIESVTARLTELGIEETPKVFLVLTAS